MTLPKHPMLAARKFIPSKVRFPCIMQPKIDGFRCLISNGIAYARSLKPFRNVHVQKWADVNRYILEGLDGELVVGDPQHPDTFNKTSAVNAFQTKVDFLFCVYDMWDQTEGTLYESRQKRFREALAFSNAPNNLRECPSFWVNNLAEIEEREAEFLAQGYEGGILRNPYGAYKYGRATENSNQLTKIKRFMDDEGIIIGWEPRYRNDNEAFIDEKGYQKRSSHQENQVPLPMVGVWILNWKGQTLRVGSGFDHSQAKGWFDFGPEKFLGRTVTFKYFPVGVKDLPRHPIFKGFREPGT